ncbi:MAG: Npt1/Npt2 family nucleotide transporter [Phycisphaerales bacterium]
MGRDGAMGGRAVGVLTAVRPGEWAALLLSGGFFFLLLFGYFLLRPVREAMGVERSMGDLRWLFGVTCVASLGAAVLFGGLVSRLDRARFIAWAFRGVVACVVAFAAVRVGFGDLFDGGVKLWSGYVFYVWLSVVNVFMTSVFWAFMADVWRLEQGKRLYAAIGVGGTIGALLGSTFAWQWVEVIGAPVQMLIAAVLFEGAVWVMRALDRRSSGGAGGLVRHEKHAMGGSWVEGVRAVARSPYLLGVGAYIVLMAVSSTLIYFTQAELVSDAEDELTSRIALFGQLDMWTQAATLFVQLFITGQLMKRAGVGVTLGVLPVVTVLGFAALALVGSREGVEAWQVFAVFAAFNAIHRATRYAVARPARETLFSVVSEREKYKAKPVVDVFLYRGGDVAGVGVSAGLGALALGLGGMAMAAAPLGVVWVIVSFFLARGQSWRASQVRAQESETESTTGATPEGVVA